MFPSQVYESQGCFEVFVSKQNSNRTQQLTHSLARIRIHERGHQRKAQKNSGCVVL